MKRVVLSVCAAVAAAVSAWGAQVPVTCVQEGLIALYDGIYNSVNEAGEPVHDESFVGLVDFISGHNLTLEKGSSYELAADHLRLNTAKSPSDSTTFSAAHPEIALAYTNRVFTLEMHLVNAGHFNGGYTMSFGQKNTSNRCLSFYDWSNKAYDGVMVWDTSGASSGVADPGLNKHHTVTFVAEGGTAYKFYIDGVLKKSLSKTQGTLADDVLALGGGHISGGMTEPQSYYSIRAYNRVLSADEIAMNRAFDRMRFEGVPFEEAFGDGWRMSPDGEALQCRVRVVSPVIGVDIGVVNFTTGTNDFWVTHGERVTVYAQTAPGQRVIWADAPAGSVSSYSGDQVSFMVTKPLAMAVAETFTPTHVWTGAASTDFASAANWVNGEGAAVSAAPGADANVFIPVGAANQPTASEPIDVAELRIGRLANEGGTATFTSGTNAMHHVAGELIVYTGGKMTHTALPSAANAAKDECYKLNVTAQSITIKSGGMIDVSECGYAGAKGPGISSGQDGGWVASHGGAQALGKSYGSLHSPTNCGSGSNHSSYGSSRGGGAVQLVASGNITIEGNANILAEGGPGVTKSSGAGGSVWLRCATLRGAGTISVSAKDPNYGMGGSGGRIAVWQSAGTDFTTEWSGKMLAVSGSSDNAWRNRGGPGTIYLQAKGEMVTTATVIIDNDNKIHSQTTAVYSGSYVYNGFAELCARTGSDRIGNLIVRKKAHALVPTGETLQIYGNIDTTGGYTYTVGAAVQMCGPKTATISGSHPYANFICTEPGKTLLFGTEATDCFEISAGGSLTLAGTEESTVNLFPAGDDPSKLWAMKFGVDAVSDVNYASVSNSNASAGDKAVTAYFSNNLGGNSKWAFTTPVIPGETITWTGAANDDWDEPANWSRGRMVEDTDVVVIPSEKGGEAITNMPKISVGNITLNALTVEAGATLTLNGTPSLTVTNSLAVAGALVVASKMKITCTKDVNFAGGSFAAGDSIFLLTEGDDQSVNLNNQRFKNLMIRKESGSVIFSEGWEADVFDCSSTDALALTFAAGKTYKAEECAFCGRRADGGRALTLRSSTPESAWNLALGSAQYIAGVDVQDSTATLAAAVVDSSSRNSGGNVNWTFSETGVTNAFWTGGTGSFDTPGGWDTGVVPDANTRVTVWASPGETKAVTASSAVTVRELVLIGVDTGKAGLTASKSLTVLGDVDVSANATLTVADPEGNTVNGDVIVRTGGTITQSADTAKDYKLKLSVDGNLTVEHDGKIHATGKGHAAMTGPGAAGTGNRGAGGHAGLAYDSLGCYGSVLQPTTCGSGGCESRGGGVVQLNVAGTVTVDGEISANGAAGATYASAGGGSVWLVCRSLAGGGLIAANSDTCKINDGGGGGRVAIEVAEADTFTGKAEAGGTGSSASTRSAYDDFGGAGTVYRIGPNQPAGGEIIIDNAQIARDVPSVAMSRIAKTWLPMADDGKPTKAYRDKLLTIGRKARVTITQPMRVGDLNFTASGSILELGTNTLTISSQAHKDGLGWASGISITSNQAPNGVWGKIVWKKPGFALIVR